MLRRVLVAIFATLLLSAGPASADPRVDVGRLIIKLSSKLYSTLGKKMATAAAVTASGTVAGLVAKDVYAYTLDGIKYPDTVQILPLDENTWRGVTTAKSCAIPTAGLRNYCFPCDLNAYQRSCNHRKEPAFNVRCQDSGACTILVSYTAQQTTAPQRIEPATPTRKSATPIGKSASDIFFDKTPVVERKPVVEPKPLESMADLPNWSQSVAPKRRPN